jgi:hypothetical protein
MSIRFSQFDFLTAESAENAEEKFYGHFPLRVFHSDTTEYSHFSSCQLKRVKLRPGFSISLAFSAVLNT